MNLIPALTLLFVFRLSHAFSFKSLGKKINSGVQLALNYTIFNQTLSFKELADFSGESVLKVSLAPGGAIKFACGTNATRRSGLISVHPPDLINFSLAPVPRGGPAEGVNRVLRNFDLFRSDRSVIYATGDILDGVYLVQYPHDAVIVSPNPDFTLNFACVYHEAGGAEPAAPGLEPAEAGRLLYKWVEVTFSGVLPMSYGCGSGNYPLFANLSPVVDSKSAYGSALQTRASCDIDPAPGMIVGIYCQDKEQFKDDLCFRDLEGKTYYDLTFEHTTNSGRLHLFRVPKEGFGGDVSFLCECKNRLGESTASVKVTSVSEYICDFTRIYNRKGSNFAIERLDIQSCKRDLHPGERLRLILPPASSKVLFRSIAYKPSLAPPMAVVRTYVQRLQNSEVGRVNAQVTVEDVRNLIISDGFNVQKATFKGYDEFLFSFDKGAFLILKSEITSLSYYWVLSGSENTKFDVNGDSGATGSPHVYNKVHVNKIAGVVNVGMVPTDPYTHGCGVRNDLFRKELVEFSSSDEGGRVASRCVVDARKHSPIGFYCPKPNRLVPLNCFESMVLLGADGSDEGVVPLDEFVGKFNAVKTKNLVVLEVFDSKFSGAEAERRLACRCLDENGDELAQITVVLSNSEDAPVEVAKDMGDGAIDPQLLAEDGVEPDEDFSIETRIH